MSWTTAFSRTRARHRLLAIVGAALLLCAPNERGIAEMPSNEGAGEAQDARQFDGAIVWIEVSDLEASKAWYEQVINANFFSQPRENMLIGTTPMQGLGIGLVAVESPVVSEISPLTINVRDLEEVTSSLSARGYALAEPVLETEHVSRVGVYKDPDGHTITFSQFLGE